MTTTPRDLRPIPKGVSKFDMRRHVRELCAAYSIGIQIRNYPRATASAQWRMIWIPEVRSEVTYAKALHEIGHVVCGHVFDTNVNILTREGEAWEWARDNAIIWTPRMDEKACKWATTYVVNMAIRMRRGNKQWKHRPVAFPPANDPIWKFTNVIPKEANV